MMRMVLPMVIALFAIFGAVAQEKWTGIARYAADNAQRIAEGNTSQCIVMIGNSITDNWASLHPEFFKQHRELVPRGISGQTSYQMLVRFREDVLNLRPKAVVINCGTNDIAENFGIAFIEQNTLGNICSMVELAKAHQIEPVLSSVLPAKVMYWAKDKTHIADKIRSLNQKIKAYAERQGVKYIDYYTPLVYGRECELNPDFTHDGVHPTLDGYIQVMEPLLLEALNLNP
ncbi:MAG: GDSL-type esterase/lipase family protein [Sodaliphilus sp.]